MMSTIDEYSGVGGAYILDPKTGTRKPVKPSEPAQPPTTKEVTTDATANEETADSMQD